MKKFTLREVFAAIRKNGYKKAYGTYIRTNNGLPAGKVISACAIGQAALNLNVSPSVLADSLHKFKATMGGVFGPYDIPLESRIFSLNDSETEDLSLPEIADTVEKEYKNYLDEIIYVG